MTPQEQIEQLNKAHDQATAQLGKLAWELEKTQAAIQQTRTNLSQIETAQRQLQMDKAKAEVMRNV